MEHTENSVGSGDLPWTDSWSGEGPAMRGREIKIETRDRVAPLRHRLERHGERKKFI